jgi:DNA-binding NarL/FixJ family response regulator
MTSIMVVEDHPVFVQSLVRLLRERGKFEATAVGTAERALELLSEVDFDLALIDVSLPGMSGMKLISAIHALKPDLPCMMVSGHLAKHYVQQSMAAGARGYALKEDISGILEGVHAVLSGETFVSKAIRSP